MSRVVRRWPSPRAASARAASLPAVHVRELELDLDAFEGPFDLLLTLVLREELQPRDVDVADVVIAFVERLAEREVLDLDACGEFLVLVGALLELKARELFRALLRRRRRFDFEQEVAGLSRVEQAIAFLALLELRKGGEIRIEQAAPFAPIRIARPAGEEGIPTVDEEGDSSWNVRSA